MHMFSGRLFAAILSTALPLASPVLAQDGALSCGQPYTVTSGDTLSKIALRAYGSTAFATLYQANLDTVGPDPNLIFIGQRLVIPCPESQTVAVAAPAPSQPDAAVTNGETDRPTAVSQTEKLILTFNKVSAPKFIANSGIIDRYLAEITEVTEGRVQFVDPPVMNRDSRAQLDLLLAGEFDGTYIFNGYLKDSHPLLQLPMLPLMGGSAEQTAVSLWHLHEDYLSQTDYFSEAHLLGFMSAPTAHIWRLNSAPVRIEDDIANMNNYAIPYFEGLDTRGPAAVREENAMQLAAYDEATNGTLTFFMAHGAARAAGVWSDDRTVTEVENGLYTPTFSILLSNEAWARISPQDQQAIEEISGDRLAHRSASWDGFDNGHRQHMIESGLNAVKASDDILAQLEVGTQARIQEWVEMANAMGIPGQEAVDSYRADLASMQDLLVFK